MEKEGIEIVGGPSHCKRTNIALIHRTQHSVRQVRRNDQETRQLRMLSVCKSGARMFSSIELQVGQKGRHYLHSVGGWAGDRTVIHKRGASQRQLPIHKHLFSSDHVPEMLACCRKGRFFHMPTSRHLRPCSCSCSSKTSAGTLRSPICSPISHSDVVAAVHVLERQCVVNNFVLYTYTRTGQGLGPCGALFEV